MSDVLLVSLLAATLVLPGLAVGLGAGLHGWTAFAASPVVSYGLTTMAGQLCTFLGIRFGLLPVLATTAAATGAILAGRRLRVARHRGISGPPDAGDGDSAQTLAGGDDRARNRRANDLWITAGILLGTALGAATVLTAMGSLDAVTQGTDSIWHVNVIRFIIESGNASPTALAEVRGVDQGYYPNAYHAGVALAGMLTSSSLMALTGAHLMLVAGVTGLGLAGLLRLFTGRTAIAAATPVVVAMFYLFPYYLMAWGPLWPFVTGIALIPGFVLLFAEALDRGARAISVMVVAGVGAAGLLGVHTSAAVTAAIFIFFLMAARWIKARAWLGTDVLVVGGVGLASVLAAPAYVDANLGVGRLVTEANVDWPVVGTPGAMLGNLLFLNTASAYPPYWLIGLIIIGVLGWRRLKSLFWWFAASVVFLGLYVAAASYNSPLTEGITILWWNDYLRLGGIVMLALIILAACGLVTLTDSITSAARRRIPAAAQAPSRRMFAAAGLTVALGLGLLTSGFYFPANGANLNAIYQDGPLISADEQAAMGALADMVEPGDRVMNDPNDGSPWMWALVNVRPMFAHTVADITNPAFTDDDSLLLQSFRCLDSDLNVRDAIERNHITHVFLGQGFIGSNFNRVQGLENVGSSDSLSLVYDREGVEIYEIDFAPLMPSLANCEAQNR